MKEKLREKLRLYLVTDRELARGRTEEEVVKKAAAGGITAVQLRGKEMTSRELFEIGLHLRRITRDLGILFIINDRLDIALCVEADGVHLGQSDLPLAAAKKLGGNKLIYGVTAETPEQARSGEKEGADYIGTAAVFATSTKEYPIEPLGLGGLKELVEATSLPVVAIGGLNVERAPQVMNTGVAGIAVVSAIVSAPDIKGAAENLTRAIEEDRREQ